MLFRDYQLAEKSMVMLEARESLSLISYTNFAEMKDSAKVEIQRDLKERSEMYILRQILDYKEVAANLARKLARGRR